MVVPEIAKLNLLNHFLGVEALPLFDKLHLIFEKFLEEVTIYSFPIPYRLMRA